MTGRKTLKEIREQLAAARAGAARPAADPSGVLEALDRLADELGRPERGPDEGPPQRNGTHAGPVTAPDLARKASPSE